MQSGQEGALGAGRLRRAVWAALGSHCPQSRSSEETRTGSLLDPPLCLQLTLVCNFLFEFFDLSY